MPRYIDADKVLQYPLRRDRCDKEHANPHFINGVESVMEYIEYLLEEEPADVQEVRHAYWEARLESEITGWNPEFAGRDPIGGYYCSNCHYEAIYSCNDEYVLSAYCPNCGARMMGGETDG